MVKLYYVDRYRVLFTDLIRVHPPGSMLLGTNNNGCRLVGIFIYLYSIRNYDFVCPLNICELDET